MATRPKQRVLVRWNDDLDKSLLLFITHTCTELGIKIPYDEVARRMGSTFSEGAIQQHISKLRNKMAELNVAPVPAAPKRGAVTSKPSSVYGQKGRAGPAPQQPVASKTQARLADPQVTRSSTSNSAGKRSTRRKPAGVKRSESDNGETDDEFGGMSEDDFSAEANASGKRGRSTRNQGRASKKVSSSRSNGMLEAEAIVRNLADADARYEANQVQNNTQAYPDSAFMFVQPSVDGMHGPLSTGAGNTSHFGQLMRATEEHEEEEEVEDERARDVNASNQFAVPMHNPAFLHLGQEEQLSPTSMPQMATPVTPYSYSGSHSMVHDYPGSFQQMSQPIPIPQHSPFIPSSADIGSSNYQTQYHAGTSAGQNYMTPHMLPSPYPSAPTFGPSGLQMDSRNHSMGSSSSQNTFGNPPHTPAAYTSSPQPSPYNAWIRNDFETSSATQGQMMNGWGFDGEAGNSIPFESALREELAVGDIFAQELFE